MVYTQVSTKNTHSLSEPTDVEALYETSKANPYRKTTHSQKCTKRTVCYTKYGLIFSGIITLILMVVLGINNVATNFDTNNTTELTTVLNTTETTVLNTTETTVLNTTETTVLNTTETTRVNESSSVQPEDDDEEIQSTPKVEESDEDEVKVTTDLGNLINGREDRDIVISNKTVIINGGNDSIIITN